MNTKQFAEKMGVNYCTVTRWLRQEIVPGATRNWNGKDWDIPDEALQMVRPKTGPKPKGEGIIKTKAESAAIRALREELGELNIRHMNLMQTHAGTRGRLDHVNDLYARALHDLKHKELEIEALKEGLDVADSRLRLLEERISQLEGGNALPVLPIRGQ